MGRRGKRSSWGLGIGAVLVFAAACNDRDLPDPKPPSVEDGGQGPSSAGSSTDAAGSPTNAAGSPTDAIAGQANTGGQGGASDVDGPVSGAGGEAGDSGVFFVACGNGVVDGDDECERLQGCEADARCTAACECVSNPTEPPTSQALIEATRSLRSNGFPNAAVYADSLMQRGWALFQAAELPLELEGAGSEGEDTSLFLELSLLRAHQPNHEGQPTLPAEVEAAVAPYLLRPADPVSAFPCPLNDLGQPDWRAHETQHFAVWSCGGGTSGPDLHAAARTTAGSAAEQVWAAMVPAIGSPIVDDDDVAAGAVARTDIYLLDLNECRLHDGACAPIPGRPLAATIPTTPCANAQPVVSSAFIELAASSVPTTPTGPAFATFRYALAHQFFHVLSFGINLGAQGAICPDGEVRDAQRQDSWLIEAAAEWASYAFFADDHRERRAQLFEDYQYRSRPDRDGLQDSFGYLPYQGSLFLEFLQARQGGEPKAIIDALRSVGSARNAWEWESNLDSVLDFREGFREFAVRGFNRPLPGAPIQPLADIDSVLTFGTPASPVLEPPITLTGSTQLRLPLQVAGFSKQTEHYILAANVRSLRIDLTPLAAEERVAIDVLVKVGANYERRRARSPVYEFCREDGADQDISELYVIFTNIDREYQPLGYVATPDSEYIRDGSVHGEFELRARTFCPGGWRGVIHRHTTGTHGILVSDEYWTPLSGERFVPPGFPQALESERLRTAYLTYGNRNGPRDPLSIQTSGLASSEMYFDARLLDAGRYSFEPRGSSLELLQIPELSVLSEDAPGSRHFTGSYASDSYSGHAVVTWDLRIDERR